MQESARLLKDLVSLPSINPMGRALRGPEYYEHRVTTYLEKYFQQLGVRYEVQEAAPGRANVVAYHEPADAASTLVLEVHQDTVPVDQMTIDPFGGHVEGGRLYGRGACDVKGGMVAMLQAFSRLAREKPRSCRVVMACTVDEEHTFLGVQRLVQTPLRRRPDEPIAAVVAEPTGLNIVNAHKGVVRWRLATAGRSCHSSRPEQGVNAIYAMGELLPHIRDYAQELASATRDPLLGPATLSVGRIDGGTSVNTVPDHCSIDIDRRLIPGEEPARAPGQLEGYLRQRVRGDLQFSSSAPILQMPALGPVGSEGLCAELGSAIDAVVGRHEVMPVPYGTDASTLAAAGIPAVVFGPGDIAQAHTCDEWIELSQIDLAAEVLYRLACAR